jgi:NitT/TauT family transport system permease protein
MAISVPPSSEETGVVVRPSLNHDLAGLAALLFVVITYHIHHPTLLFRAQFGRAFRGDGLQEGVAVGLGLAFIALVLAWRKGRAWAFLPWVLVAGLGFYTLHVMSLIFADTSLFYDFYDVTPDYLKDVFREETFVPAMQASNVGALFSGAVLLGIIILWSPWAAWRGVENPLRLFLHTASALCTGLSLWALAQVLSPALADRTTLGIRLQDEGLELPTLALFILGAGGLCFFAPQALRDHLSQGVFWAVGVLLALYGLHAGLALVARENLILRYYGVDEATYVEFFPTASTTPALLALDRAALLAGAALLSVFLLWAPWERLSLYRETLRANLIPLSVGILTLLIWEGLIELLRIEQFLLPRPSVIGAELRDIYPALVAAGWFTFLNAFKGFFYGCLAGVITGIITARFRRFSAAVLPLAIAANSVPIIAFAPIANFWFGVTSPNSKIAIVAVLCYFPAMISTVRGLTSVDATQLELLRSYAASEFEIFRKLRFPNAYPYMFSAFKLSATLAMIGAIVSEFFGGSLAGLGYRIREDAALFRFPASWSAIVVASLFGIGFYLFITALERAVMPWYRSFREG